MAGPNIKPENIKFALSILAVCGFIWGVAEYLSPIREVPEDLRKMEESTNKKFEEMKTQASEDLGELKEVQNEIKAAQNQFSQVQGVHTYALQGLAKLTNDTAQMRRDIDSNKAEVQKTDIELREIKRRLDTVENNRP